MNNQKISPVKRVRQKHCSSFHCPKLWRIWLINYFLSLFAAFSSSFPLGTPLNPAKISTTNDFLISWKGNKLQPITLSLPSMPSQCCTANNRRSRISLSISEYGDCTEPTDSRKSVICTKHRCTREESICNDSVSKSISSTKPNSRGFSRRQALQSGAAFSSSVILLSAPPANAGRPEIDSKSGELYSPKNKMLGGGGSDAARGIKLESRNRDWGEGGEKRTATVGKGSGPLQTVYDTRFIAYLSRFLLNFDPAAKSWWMEQDFTENTNMDSGSQTQLRFAEFAESVEIGLADYFIGPYGSYASVQAAKAGLTAAEPATSSSSRLLNRKKSFISLFQTTKKSELNVRKKKDEENLTKQGILNLFSLLKARYTSTAAKSQLALLFSFISNPILQPTSEIEGLLGEVDNATVTGIELIGLKNFTSDNFRMSSRYGGGYSIEDPPKVSIEPPPPLGAEFRQAKVVPMIKPTTRILKIRVLDGGEGYTSIPTVKVVQGGVRIPCDACAILDRNGSVESIVVLNPGLGYGNGKRGKVEIPQVQISPPRNQSMNGQRTIRASNGSLARTAIAVAELEYAITGLEIVDGGNGYVVSKPPSVVVMPPEDDPDWYINPLEQKTWKVKDVSPITGEVSLMEKKDIYENIPSSTNEEDVNEPLNMEMILDKISKDPLVLFPPRVRPLFVTGLSSEDLLPMDKMSNKRLFPKEGLYMIPSIPPARPNQMLPSARYRAFDPIFGGVGAKPVTKGAKSLTSGEYSRLALSGAICTVIVRTALNPLELVKTKIQLQNDDELIQYALNGSKLSDRAKNDVANDAMLKMPNNFKSTQSLEVTEAMPVGAGVESNGTLQLQNLNKPKGTSGLNVALEKSQGVSISTSNENLKGSEKPKSALGTVQVIKSLIELRGPLSLFQSADITFLASLVFGSFGFGATELFRRSFTSVFFPEDGGGKGSQEITLLIAAAFACVITSAAAAPFEILRVRSMGYVEAKQWTKVLSDFLLEKRLDRGDNKSKKQPRKSLKNSQINVADTEIGFVDIRKEDLGPLFSGFYPIVSRELPFALAKFLAFDLVASTFVAFINTQPQAVETVQVGIGPVGLAVSAISGAIAGIVGAFISHPADLILTLTSSSGKNSKQNGNGEFEEKRGIKSEIDGIDWKEIVKDLLSKDGGILNLYAGLPARATFFFLVIGLQFFLYDYAKIIFQVGSEDLTLVLDVFYAIRQGLVNMDL